MGWASGMRYLYLRKGIDGGWSMLHKVQLCMFFTLYIHSVQIRGQFSTQYLDNQDTMGVISLSALKQTNKQLVSPIVFIFLHILLKSTLQALSLRGELDHMFQARTKVGTQVCLKSQLWDYAILEQGYKEFSFNNH